MLVRVDRLTNPTGSHRPRRALAAHSKREAALAQPSPRGAKCACSQIHPRLYREVSLQVNARQLDALAAVDDLTKGKQTLQRLTTMKKDAAGRRLSADGPGFYPMAQPGA